MKDLLLNLYNSSPRSFAQKLKSKENVSLYNWFVEETAAIPENTISGKAYIYLFQPDLTCEYGNSKKFSQGKIRLCGANKSCQCFVDKLNENRAEGFWSTEEEKELFLQKRNKEWKEKYGTNPLCLPENRQKRLDAVALRDNAKFRQDKQNAGYEQVTQRVADVAVPLFTKEEYNGSFRKNFYKWECVACNTEFEHHIDYGTYPKCPSCYPNNKSAAEYEIAQFITDLGHDTVTNTKRIIPPQELDIWIPDKNIAIEYNGVYWHSVLRNPDTKYHLNKYLACKDKGIHLIQIFDVDWENKKDLIKNRIKTVLGNSEKIHGRKTTVTRISNTAAKGFCKQHHLAGWATANVCYGAFFKDELVAVMTFAKPRYNKIAEYELVRYCSAGQIVGGAGKLFARFCNDFNPNSIISYADRCWSNGKLYRQLGFEDFTEETNVGYFYADRDKRYHRSSFTKKRLVEMGYSEKLTEEEIMLTHLKMHKVYDCGNYKFLWKQVDNKS